MPATLWSRRARRPNSSGNRLGLQVEVCEARTLLTLAVEFSDITYFFSSATTQVERYDLINESWLAPITLSAGSGVPTAATVDSDGIYVAFDRAVYRYTNDGSSATHLLNSTSQVHGLHTDGNLLFLNHSSGLYARLLSLDKSNNQLIDDHQYYTHSLFGSSINPEKNQIFGRTSGISPADIDAVTYDDDGYFLRQVDSPYHGSYGGGTRTFVFPDGKRVTDTSGNIYATDNMFWIGSFGSRVDDVKFYQDEIPVVRNGRTFTAYSKTMLPTGSHTIGFDPITFAVNDSHLITFRMDASSTNGMDVELISLDEIGPDDPGDPIDPTNLAYTPDHIESMPDGDLLLFSRSHHSIFRWDAAGQSYIDSIPLTGTPTYMTYSAETNHIYVAYANGWINQIDLDASTPSEVPFATLSTSPLGLATAGSYLFAVDSAGAWYSHYTDAPDGSLISSVDWNRTSHEFIWSDANQRMYFFRAGTSPNDLHAEEINADGVTYSNLDPGAIGRQYESPLHSSAGFSYPIRVSPDGKIVVLGSGLIHDAVSLVRLPSGLANSVKDVAWLNEGMYSLREIGGLTQLQKWGTESFELLDATSLTGDKGRLFAIDGETLLAMTLVNGVPTFRVLDAEFEQVFATNLRPTVDDATFTIHRRMRDGEEIGTVHASDPDLEQTINYSIVSGNQADTFRIDQSGKLFLVDPGDIDFFAGGTIELTIRVTDNGDPILSDQATIRIEIEQIAPSPISGIAGVDELYLWLTTPDVDHQYVNDVAGLLPRSVLLDVKYGDFNGDGSADIAAWLNNGEWVVSLNLPSGFTQFARWVGWRTSDVKEVHVGDFNGDGKDDLIGFFRSSDGGGRWWLGESDGTRFENKYFGDFGSYDRLHSVYIGNFDETPGDELAVVSTTGVCWQAYNDNSRMRYLMSHRWQLDNGFEFAQVGDFNADGIDDIVVVLGSERHRSVIVAQASPGLAGFTRSKWSNWFVRQSLDAVVVGDFNGDGLDDIAGIFNGGNIWQGTSDGHSFDMSYWLDWKAAAGQLCDIAVGESNGDGLADIFGRTQSGQWHAAESTGTSFVDRELVQWDQTSQWDFVYVGDFSSPPAQTPPAASSFLANPGLADRWSSQADSVSRNHVQTAETRPVSALALRDSEKLTEDNFEIFGESSLLDLLSN